VAEGIEEEEQLKTLQKMNCHLGQGFLFSWPLGPKEIEHYFSQGFSCCLNYDPSEKICPDSPN
jgi:EAL domain-containing protein (putative c-di-GMP-specific phosphodiesterase class I)